jgi:hypothetical protein
MCSNILFKRLAPYVKDIICGYQYEFRQGRSTSYKIVKLRQVLKKCKESGIKTYHLFTDFKVAYGSIDRFNLYIAKKEFQIPRKLIALIKAILSNTLCQIRIQNLLSDPIHIKMVSGKEIPWPAYCLI